MNYGIIFDDSLDLQLVVYTDTDWVGDKSDCKSTIRSLIKIVRELVYWYSIKQISMSLFITETEYIAVSETSHKIISICDILQELKMIDFNFIFFLLIDNNSMIAVSKDEKITCNICHIEICYHHIQDLIEKVIIDIIHIPSAQMTADSFTKPLNAVKFDKFCDLIGIEDCEWTQGGEPANWQAGEPASKKTMNENMLVVRKTLYNGYFTPDLPGIVLEYTANFVYRFQPLSHVPDE